MREYQFLLLIFIIFSLLRFPSFFEPNWYGDEGIYQVVGKAVRNGRILYKEIWDNKPPLLYLTYAVVNGDHFAIRFLSYVAGLFSVAGMYLLSLILFKKQNVALGTTWLFGFFFAIPLTESNIANAENFMLVFSIFSAWLFYRAIHQRSAEAKPKTLLFFQDCLLQYQYITKSLAFSTRSHSPRLRFSRQEN